MDNEMETGSDNPKVFLETEEVETPKEELKPVTEIEHDEFSPQVQPEVEVAKKGGYKWLVVVAVVLVVAAIVVWGIIFWQKSKPATKMTIDISPTTPIVEEIPTPTPVAEFKLSDYKIKVLNGSGTAGEAGRVKTLLETAGFVVESTANAETYDFTKTIISAGGKVAPGFVGKLQDELGKKYVIGPAGSLDSETGVQVVVGTEKAQ